MKPFVPSPLVRAYYEALIQIATAPLSQADNFGGWPLLVLDATPLPMPPLAPADPVEAAFFQRVCLALAATIQAARDMQRASIGI